MDMIELSKVRRVLIADGWRTVMPGSFVGDGTRMTYTDGAGITTDLGIKEFGEVVSFVDAVSGHLVVVPKPHVHGFEFGSPV